MGVDRLDYREKVHMPRGIRNNNPGNIRINQSSNWKGKVTQQNNTDGIIWEVDGEKKLLILKDYEQFIDITFGIRAMIIFIKTCQTKYGINTIEGLINVYYPHNKKMVESFIKFLEKNTMIQRNYEFSYRDYDRMFRIVRWICKWNTGQLIVKPLYFQKAWAMA